MYIHTHRKQELWRGFVVFALFVCAMRVLGCAPVQL